MAAMTDPGRLVRKSINVATARLGDRREACRIVWNVANNAAMVAGLCAQDAGMASLPLAGWLDQVALEAERMARLAGAIE